MKRTETSAALVVFAAALGFFGGALLLSAFGWLWPVAVGFGFVVCVALAWEVAR